MPANRRYNRTAPTTTPTTATISVISAISAISAISFHVCTRISSATIRGGGIRRGSGAELGVEGVEALVHLAHQVAHLVGSLVDALLGLRVEALDRDVTLQRP